MPAHFYSRNWSFYGMATRRAHAAAGDARSLATEVIMSGWVPTGNLNVPRGGHTATLLRDGTVLVYGGYTESGPLSSAELFHPGTGTWAATGSAFYERSGHTATLLGNGKVLVEGGMQTDQPNTPPAAELYDPATGEWYATGKLNFARYGEAATLLSDGRVLVVGGNDANNLAQQTVNLSAEIYDPVTQVWTPTGTLVFGRSYATATLLTNGQVLVVGTGTTSDKEAQKTCELYEPAAGRWRLTGVLAIARTGHTATRLNDGTVLVTGGQVIPENEPVISIPDAEIFDPTTELWSVVSPLTMARQNHTATLLPDGGVLVVGGIQNDQSGSRILKSTELYDTAMQTWILADNLNTARAVHTQTLLQARRPVGSTQFTVIVAGGGDDAVVALNSVELFSSGPPQIHP